MATRKPPYVATLSANIWKHFGTFKSFLGGVAPFTQKVWHVPFFETIGRRSGGIDGRAGGRDTGN